MAFQNVEIRNNNGNLWFFEDCNQYVVYSEKSKLYVMQMYISHFNVIYSPEWINFFHRMLGVGNPTAAQSIHTLWPRITDVFFGSTVHWGGTTVKEQEKKERMQKLPNTIANIFYCFFF